MTPTNRHEARRHARAQRRRWGLLGKLSGKAVRLDRLDRAFAAREARRDAARRGA